MSRDKSHAREVHWARTRAATFLVLFIWFVFSLVAPWFAKELDEFQFMGFKLGYYLVVQGSLAVFVLLIIFHNLYQDSVDDKYGRGE